MFEKKNIKVPYLFSSYEAKQIRWKVQCYYFKLNQYTSNHWNYLFSLGKWNGVRFDVMIMILKNPEHLWNNGYNVRIHRDKAFKYKCKFRLDWIANFHGKKTFSHKLITIHSKWKFNSVRCYTSQWIKSHAQTRACDYWSAETMTAGRHKTPTAQHWFREPVPLTLYIRVMWWVSTFVIQAAFIKIQSQ